MKDDLLYRARIQFVFFSVLFLACVAAGILSSLYWLMAIPLLVVGFYLAWQHGQILFYLLIFSLPWSFEYSFNASLGTDVPDEFLMILTATIFVAMFFFRPVKSGFGWNHPLIILLFILLDWLLVSVIFSTESFISTKFFLAKTWYLGAFVFAPLLIFKNKRAIRLTGLIFLSSMLMVTVLILFRQAFNGFRFAQVNQALTPFFRNHVNYSAMLVCALPVLITAWQVAKKYRFLVVIGIAIVIIALFFSYARGAWLALFIGLASYFLIRKRMFLIAFISFFIICLAATRWLSSNDRYLHYAGDFRTTIFHTDFRQHLIATYQLKDLSTAERFNRWVAGVRMIKTHWITGYGPNTFYDHYKPYASPAFRTWVSDNPEHSTVHNYFLLVLIEQGVTGLLFFLALTGAMIYYSEMLYKRIVDPFYKAVALCCGVMLAMIITVNFLSDLIETDKIGSLFFLCLATLVTVDQKTKNQDSKMTANPS